MAIRTRDEIQEDLAKQILDKNCLTLTNIACRTGKIRICLKYVVNPKEKLLVIYPEVDIKESWIKEYEILGLSKENCTFSTTRSIKKISVVPDIIILDEFHDYSPKQREEIKQFVDKHKIKKIIGLSGTVSEKTQEKWKKEFGMEVGVMYSTKQAIEDGVLSDYRIKVYKVALSKEENIPKYVEGKKVFISEKRKFDAISWVIDKENEKEFKDWKKLKMLRLNRASLIKKSFAKISATKRLLSIHKEERILVFAGLIEVIEGLGIPTFHSKSKESEMKDKFLNGEIPHLAIVNKLSMGITFKKISKSLLNYFDSNPENMAQRIHRITSYEYENPDKVAEILIVCSKEPIEESWLASSLEFFDQKKISYHEL